MKKSDLKSGMIVELGNGNKFLVLKDACFNNCKNNFVGVSIIGDYDWLDLNGCYNEDMLNKLVESNNYNIMKVYSSSRIDSFLTLGMSLMELIWEREDKKQELKEFERKLNELTDDFKKLANRW